MQNKRRLELEQKVLSGDTASIRRFATEIRAYQKSSDPAVLSILLEALKNSDSIGSRIIVQLLPVVPEIEPVLVSLLENEPSSSDSFARFVQTDAVQKLEKLATPTALQAIRNWTLTTSAAGESRRIDACIGIRSLGHVKDSSSLPIIHDCLGHDDPHIRSAAICAVRMMQDRTAVPKLLDLLSDKSIDPQLPEILICDSVAQALGEIGDLRAVEPIATMIETGQTGPIPDGAIYALTLLGQPGYTALNDMLAHVNSELRAKIVLWLR
jgi:HEAT repeat protein